MSEESSAKASSFLSALRGEPVRAPRQEPPPEAAVAPLKRRIDELENKLQQLAKTAGPPEEGEPPRPPTEIMMYIHTRMELLERKLEQANEEAVRANLLLREREDAQRKAQKEVEELFRSIREQQRAASWDAALRDRLSEAHQRIQALESRLAESELKTIPAEDVLRALRAEEGRAELERLLQERLARMGAVPDVGAPGASPEAPGAPPVPPAPPISADTGSTLFLIGRIAELERKLQESHAAQEEERRKRGVWEKDVLEAIAKAPQRWRNAGGPELTVEATLEALALTLKERDAVQAELADAVNQAQDQPPGSPADPVLRSRIAAAQRKLNVLQDTIAKQFSVVQAWLQRSS